MEKVLFIGEIPIYIMKIICQNIKSGELLGFMAIGINKKTSKITEV